MAVGTDGAQLLRAAGVARVGDARLSAAVRGGIRGSGRGRERTGCCTGAGMVRLLLDVDAPASLLAELEVVVLERVGAGVPLNLHFPIPFVASLKGRSHSIWPSVAFLRPLVVSPSRLSQRTREPDHGHTQVPKGCRASILDLSLAGTPGLLIEAITAEKGKGRNLGNLDGGSGRCHHGCGRAGRLVPCWRIGCWRRTSVGCGIARGAGCKGQRQERSGENRFHRGLPFRRGQTNDNTIRMVMHG